MIKANEIGQRIEDWFKLRAFTSVNFLRNENPKNDPDDDYVVVEDICISSPNLALSSVEVSITREGHIGIGVERRERIASRLGLNLKSPRFAGGFEPLAVPEAVIHKILDLTARGSISISYFTLPLFGIVSTKLNLPEDEIQILKSLGLSSADQVFNVTTKESAMGKTIRFEPWK